MNGSSGPPIKVEKDERGHTDSGGEGNRQEERQVPANNERDQSTDSSGIGNPQQLVQVGELSYREITIKIFTDRVSEKNKNSLSFFFEPIAVLDSKSVIIQSQKLFKEDVVRFSIQMWNQEIRSKVLDHLRLDHPEMKEKDVHVMPYVEVQLVGKPGGIHQSIKIMEEATPYHRLNEKLDFFLLCDSPSTAKGLADNLRNYPDFVVRKWQLTLECRGLALDDSSMTANKSSSFKFVVSTSPLDGCPTKETIVQPPLVTDYDKEIKDLKAQIQVLLDKSKNATPLPVVLARIQAMVQSKNPTCVPVFSAVECTNPSALKYCTICFASFEIETKEDFGDFDLMTGIFTVKKAGTFQFNFTGIAQMKENSRSHHFELWVDGFWKSMSYGGMTSSDGYQPVVLSAMQQLVAGQKVSVVTLGGELFDGPNTRATRFSCVFFS